MEDLKKPSYFASLLSKQVSVYREGPEYKIGTLLDVKPDFIVIKTPEEVVYYQTYHINSINEEPSAKKTIANEVAKFGEAPRSEDVEEIYYIEAESFGHLLKQLQYKSIQINRGGPESRCGILLNVKSDYLVMLTKEDGVIYYPFFHIKNISEYPMEKLNIDNPVNLPANGLYYYSQAETFGEAILDFSGRNVQINRGGHESMRGQIVSITQDFMAIQNSLDTLYIYANHHIKNISEVPSKNNTTNSKNTKKQSNEEIDASILLTKLVKLDLTNFDKLTQKLLDQKIYAYTVGDQPIEGRLVNITSNYLVVENEDGDFVCCNNEHLKVLEIKLDNGKTASKTANKNDEVKVNTPVLPFKSEVKYFSQLIRTIQDSNSYIKFGNGSAGIGKIAAQKDDLVALQTESTYMIYNPKHIKSFKIFTDTEKIQNEISESYSVECKSNNKPLIQMNNFKDSLDSLKNQWIQINKYGPSKISGMLLEVFDDYLTLFSKQKIYLIPFNQIHDIYVGAETTRSYWR